MLYSLGGKVKNMKNFFLFFLAIFFVGYGYCAPFQYYKLTITQNGWNGAQFMYGFSGFSDTNATGTNMFATYGSLWSQSSGWNWRTATFSQMANFQAGADPYIYNGNEKWLLFRLDQAREISSFKLGNWISEGILWWIEAIKIEGSNDAVSYETLYSGVVSTTEFYTIMNVQINIPVPEPSSIFFMILALSGIFLKIQKLEKTE